MVKTSFKGTLATYSVVRKELFELVNDEPRVAVYITANSQNRDPP